MTYQILYGTGGTQVSLPLCKPDARRRQIFLGSVMEAADKTTRIDEIARRWELLMEWEGLSQAERDTIYNAYTSMGALPTALVVPPDSLSVTVTAVAGSYNETFDVLTVNGSEIAVFEVSVTFRQAQ